MTLTRIAGKQATTAAIKKIRRTFREHGARQRRMLGYQGGRVPPTDVFAVDAAGVWFAYRLLDRRHWCAFGTLPLSNSGTVPITVEINPPLEGVYRRVHGLIATDGSGTQYLCHTGGIGGGKKGVGLTNFLDWFDRERVPVIDPDGHTTPAFPVAHIGSKRMVEHVAEYVWAVADFKAGRPAPRPAETMPPFGDTGEEFEGPKSIPARLGYVAHCDHGIIRNRLAGLIAATGRAVSSDQQRDLLVGDSDAPEVEFEIKTSAELQDVYTAVGQLLLHNAMKPVKRRVAVLPSDVRPKLAEAVTSLGIDVMRFRWAEKEIHFHGLGKIIPGVPETAPIHQRE